MRLPIFSVTSTPTGKGIPLDLEPAAAGDVVLLPEGTHADVLGPEAARAWVGRKFRIHFKTCPHTHGYRRKRGIP